MKLRHLIVSSRDGALRLISYAMDWIIFRRDTITPPRRLRVLSAGHINFKKSGKQLVELLIRLTGLKPDGSILDAGCGAGRIAIPLTTYMTEGQYHGFDIVRPCIEWCQRRIEKRHSNFHFLLADIHNGIYNPQGPYKASEFRFPYADESFDVAVAFAPFTHMLPPGVIRYVDEISRVLKPSGRCLATFFIFSNKSSDLVGTDQSASDPANGSENYRALNQTAPEAAVAYDEAFVRHLYRQHCLRIEEPIHHGSWNGRGKSISHQDIIVASKVARETLVASLHESARPLRHQDQETPLFTALTPISTS